MSPETQLSDEDIRTVWLRPGETTGAQAGPGTADQDEVDDADGTDNADGTDGDSTDGTDGDAGDDADGTDT